MSKIKILREKFKEQLSNTAGHGLGNIVATQNWCLKIMWFIAWLTGLGLTIYLIILSLRSYFNFEVITKIRVIDERPMIFPKVTVCNLDPFVTNESITFLADVINSSRFYSGRVKQQGLTSDLEKVNYVTLNYGKYFISDARDMLLNRESALNRKFGRSLTEFISFCSFDNSDCIMEDHFEYLYHPQFGNCYSFNSNKSSLLISSSSGKARGLQLIIYLGKMEKYETLVPSTGLKLIITNHSTLFSEEEIIDVASGTQTNIAIFKRITKTLETPYSNCEIKGNMTTRTSGNLKNYEIFSRAGLKYRSADCMNYCYSKLVLSNCGCLDSSVIFHNLEMLNVTKFCDLKRDQICIDNMKINNGKLFKETCNSACPFECDSVAYTFSTSFTRYPTRSEFLQLLNKPNANYISKSGSLDKLKDEFVRVNVYLSSLKYEYISEDPALTVTSLLGGLGGTLGLFLGFSVLSFFEIIEFMVNCLTAIKDLNKRKAKVTHVDISPKNS